MSDDDQSSGIVTGVAWYEPGDYQRLRQISADAEDLCESWEEWRENIQEQINKLTAAGHEVETVPIDLEELQSWCASNLRPVDGEARAEFANRKLRELRDDE